MRERVIAVLKHLLTRDLFVEIPPEQIDPDDGLQSVLGLDSVSFIELRVLCERHFNLRIGEDEFSPENFSSLNRLADLIVRKQAEEGAACVR